MTAKVCDLFVIAVLNPSTVIVNYVDPAKSLGNRSVNFTTLVVVFKVHVFTTLLNLQTKVDETGNIS
jgi:hypothetical protein